MWGVRTNMGSANQHKYSLTTFKSGQIGPIGRPIIWQNGTQYGAANTYVGHFFQKKPSFILIFVYKNDKNAQAGTIWYN